MHGMSAREFAEWRWLLGAPAGSDEPATDREAEHRQAVAMMESLVR